MQVHFNADTDILTVNGQPFAGAFFREIAASDFLQKCDVNALSDREVAVVRLFADGCAQKEIGSQLNISPKTVNHYLASAKTKLSIECNATLIKVAIYRRLTKLGV